MSFTIWFKPSKKEDAESNFLSIGHISNVSYDDNVTLHVFNEKSSTPTLPPAPPVEDSEVEETRTVN